MIARTNPVLVALFLTSLAVTGAHARATDEERIAVPVPLEIREQTERVRELFEDKYSKRGDRAKIDLAWRLIRSAREERSDAVAYYVLLNEARELAAKAEDPHTALYASKKLVERFRLEELAEKRKTLTSVRKSLGDRRKTEFVAERFLEIAESASKENRFDFAREAANDGYELARRARDQLLTSYSRGVRTRINRLRSRYEQLADVRQRLEHDTEDPAANLSFGRFLAFEKGDWDAGLAHLAKCGEETLVSLAKLDVSYPRDWETRAELGERWLAVADESTDKDEKLEILRRSLNWYDRAAREASGLSKMEIRQAIAELEDRLAKIDDRMKAETSFDKFCATVEVESAGNKAGNYCRIAVGGRTIDNNREGRGLHVVAIHRGKIRLREVYDTFASRSASQKLYDAISRLPRGAFVIIAVKDEATAKLQSKGQEAIYKIGGKVRLNSKRYRNSYYCVGQVGLAKGKAREAVSKKALRFPRR